ncbi:MAG: cytidine deaminase [Planctomycetota bacterium]|jgi:cytidine deaminase
MEDLIEAAIALAKERWGDEPDAGAAAMRLENGEIVTSVYVDTPNEGANLCHETGAICEAHKRNLKVLETVCVSRATGDQFVILSPCGICQERLAFWGPDVRAAVGCIDDPTAWEVKTLRELSPYYWAKVFHWGDQP